MPTYEYECQECGKTFEAFQKMTDAPLKTCKLCGGSVRRLIGTGAGIIFKGTGWYCTDFKDKKSSVSSSPSDSSSSGGSSGSDKSETAKPEAAKAVKAAGSSD